jgi:uncharacterized small protein (DUF1192 family)
MEELDARLKQSRAEIERLKAKLDKLSLRCALSIISG